MTVPTPHHPRPRWPLTLFAVITGSTASAAADPAAPDIRPFIDAIARHGCAADPHYRTVGGVPCDRNAAGASADPEAALKALAAQTKDVVQALSLVTKSEDAACAKNAGGVLATARVGARSLDELANALVKSAAKDALSLAGPAAVPAGLVLSIPGLTQVQYDYKGLARGPEVRTFRISGRVEGNVDGAKLRLKMDGDVEGDKNLYVQYEVNYQKTKQAFPAWSPFLDRPGDITRGFVRQGLNTLSSTADFKETGQHRNGVRVWHDYEYAWHAEKIGAAPADIVKRGADAIEDAAWHPFGGDWVGTGWGVETRFKASRKDFVAQISPRLAAAASDAAANAVLMSLNVKHQVVFHFHVDYDGNVTGRGAIVYTLDPDLCGVAVLTRQVNEAVNLMKYLPAIYMAAGLLETRATTRFQSTWKSQPGAITQKMDEYIAKLPRRIEPSAGARDAGEFLARFPRLRRKNPAFIDIDVAGVPKMRRWAVSGKDAYPEIAELVPLPVKRTFTPRAWAQNRAPYLREFDAEYILMEWLSTVIPRGASGTIKIYSRFPVCPSCTGVIEQAYFYFENLTVLVTSGG